MRTRMGCIAALVGAIGISFGAAAAPENNPNPLIARGVVPDAVARQKARPDPMTAIISQPDFILKDCQETESTGDSRSAMRGVDPAFMLKNYLEWHDKTGSLVVDLATIRTSLLEGAKHGDLYSDEDNTGRTSYHYDPIPEYVGKDRAVFMAEFEGKRYKIVIDLVVSLMVNENEPVCPPPNSSKSTASQCPAHPATT